MLRRQDGLFFSRWLRNPLRTGAIIPSSTELAQLMAAQVDPRRCDTVIELGGGTGAITNALLKAGVPADQLIVVEKDSEFHQLLTFRFPGVRVLRADATRLASHLRPCGPHSIDAVVSSLPMLSMSEQRQRLILKQAFKLLDANGVFIQFTYGFGPPIALAKLAEWAIEARPNGRSWRNVPPASVWRLVRQGADDRMTQTI